jgi:hypothetical protein
MKDLYREDKDSLLGVFKELQTENEGFLQRWSKVAKKCTNYANGDQTIDQDYSMTWLNGQPVYNQYNMAKSSQLNVNEIEPIIRTLVSYLSRAKPTVSVKSINYQDPKAKSIAKIGEDVVNAKYDLDEEQNNTIDAATWMLTVGTVFGKDYWDAGAGGFINGQRTGNNVAKILTPFTVSTDWSSTSFTEIPYIYENNIVDTDWLKTAYKVNASGFTQDFDGMVEGEWGNESLTRYEQFKTSVPYLGNNGDIKRKGRTLMTEMFVAPNDEFPEGRMLVFGGNKLLYSTQPGEGNPYFLGIMGQQPVWHPYSMGVYEKYLGRILGKGLVEQLLPIQMRMNEIWSTIIENANTICKPNIIAAEKQFKKGIMSGDGFKIYTYQPMPGVAEPHAFQGIPLPTQFFNELQELSNKIVQIAGTNFVMQGVAPTGVTAASAISQLIENASTQNAPINQRFIGFHEQRFTKKLRVIKKFQTFPDNQLNVVLQGIAKEEYRSTMQIFIGAQDLADNVEVKIESSSMIPKSEQSKSESLLKLVQSGFFGNLLAEDTPKSQAVRTQILEQLGLEPLLTEESVDMKKANWENESMSLGQPMPVSPRDIGPIHIQCHRELLQNPMFIENANPQLVQLVEMHLQEHEQIESQKGQQAEAQQKQMATEQTMIQAAGKQMDKAPLMANPVFNQVLQ